ncbi:MAG: hypothetical protein ABEK10_01945 [Candidatus Nanosalina sp.]
MGKRIYSGVETFTETTKDYRKCMFRINQKDFKYRKVEIKAVKFKGGAKHGFVKSMICKALHDAGHVFLTEVEFSNNREADIYDASTDSVIEVESNCSRTDRKKKLEDFGGSVHEVYIIDPKEWPDSFQEAYDRAEEEFCV